MSSWQQVRVLYWNGFRCSWRYYVLITNIWTVLYPSLLTHSEIPRERKTSSPPFIHIFPLPESRTLLLEIVVDSSRGMFRAKFCLGCVLCNLGWLWGGRRLRPAGHLNCERGVLNTACVILEQWWENVFRSGPKKKNLAGHNDLL